MAWFNMFRRRHGRRRSRSRQVREGWRRPTASRGTFEVSELPFEALADGLRLIGDHREIQQPSRDDEAA